MSVRLLCGHVLDKLAELPDASVHCVVTSPPYWGLRDYKIEPQVWGGDPGCAHRWGEWHEVRDIRESVEHGKTRTTDRFYGDESRRFNGNHQKITAGAFCRCGAWRGSLGLEPTFDLYVEHMVEVFRAVHRALRPDGTLWLNLGDCYSTGAGLVGARPGGGAQGDRWAGYRGTHTVPQSAKDAPRIEAMGPMVQPNRMPQPGLKPKDLIGIPWRVAFALQADGWWLELNPKYAEMARRRIEADAGMFAEVAE